MHFMAILLQQWQQAESLLYPSFEGMFIDVVRIPAPCKGQNKKVMMRCANKTQLCRFIFEPLVQGAAEW
jgi:adenosylmethionine-8-amino-7-oxononanoate aminotransferase